MTLGEVLRRSTDYLAEREVETPRLDAELLLGKALGCSRLQLYLEHDRPLVAAELDACRELVARRGRREPAAYILGEWGFRRLTLTTDRRALIPRPETEILVERCLELLAEAEEPRILDVGTGSGAIALALADEIPGAAVTALDVSPEALALAAENAERNGLAGRIELIRGDFLDVLPPGPFDLVVSNPPYVAEEELAAGQPEVRDWEPRAALAGGIAEAEAVAAGALRVLRPGGWLVLEAAEQRAEETAGSVREGGFLHVAVLPDLSGRPRVVEGRAPPEPRGR
jgi:release factor glutamine methyltransferase